MNEPYDFRKHDPKMLYVGSVHSMSDIAKRLKMLVGTPPGISIATLKRRSKAEEWARARTKYHRLLEDGETHGAALAQALQMAPSDLRKGAAASTKERIADTVVRELTPELLDAQRAQMALDAQRRDEEAQELKEATEDRARRRSLRHSLAISAAYIGQKADILLSADKFERRLDDETIVVVEPTKEGLETTQAGARLHQVAVNSLKILDGEANVDIVTSKLATEVAILRATHDGTMPASKVQLVLQQGFEDYLEQLGKHLSPKEYRKLLEAASKLDGAAVLEGVGLTGNGPS